MKNIKLVAKLDGNGQAWCGRRGCPADLKVRVRRLPVPDLERYEVRLAPGYNQDFNDPDVPGVWALSKHAQKKLAVRGKPGNRRPIKDPLGHRLAPSGQPGTQMVLCSPDELPRIRCHRCGKAQWVMV